MGGSVPRVNRLAHNLETDYIALLDPPPTFGARFEVGISELISDQQRRRNAPFQCGRFCLSRCGLIGWLRSRCLATGGRKQREREPSVSSERNPLTGPVQK